MENPIARNAPGVIARSCFLQCLCLTVIYVVYGLITHYGTKKLMKCLINDPEKEKKFLFKALLQFHDEIANSVGWCMLVAMVGALFETRSIRNMTLTYWSSRTVILGSIVGTFALSPILNNFDRTSYGKIVRKTIEEETMGSETIDIPLQVAILMAILIFAAGVGGICLHDVADEQEAPNAALIEGAGYLFHWVRSIFCAFALLILKGGTAGVHATLPSKPLVVNKEKNHSIDSYIFYDILGGFVAELIATLVPNQFERKLRLARNLVIGFGFTSTIWAFICHAKLDHTNISLIGLSLICGLMSNASMTLLRDAGAIHPGTGRIVGISFVILDVAGSLGAAFGAAFAASIYKDADAVHYKEQADKNWSDVQFYVIMMVAAALSIIWFIWRLKSVIKFKLLLVSIWLGLVFN